MTAARGAALAVLATCFAVLLMNSGARFAIGLLLKPMADDLGWTRSALSAGVTAFMIIAAVSLPFMGRLVDGFGPRRVLGVAVALAALGIGTLPLISSPWHLLVLYGVVFALGSAGTSITPVGVLLNRWYPQRLGMANAIAISGMGVGQLLIIAVLASVLTDIGWRGAYLALGIAMALTLVPVALMPGGNVTARAGDAPAAPGADGAVPATLRVALADRKLRWLLAMYAICGFQDFLVATHVVAHALDAGVDDALAGHMLALMGLAGLLGVLLTGWSNDRHGPLAPTVACFVVRVVLFAALLGAESHWVIVAAALAYGATFWVTAPLTVVFARERVGARLLGTVSGVITMVHHAAGGLGAIVGALVFDATGSYTGALVLMLVLSVAALATCLPLATGAAPAR